MKNNEKESEQRMLIWVIILVAILSISLRLIYFVQLEQTSLLFIGIPTLLAILVAKIPISNSSSPIGIAFKVITLFLLIAGILLGEGIGCILVAAPLFYGVAAIIIGIAAIFKDKSEKHDSLDASIIIPLVLLLAHIPLHSATPPTEKVATTVILDGNHDLSSLEDLPTLKKDLPLFFKLGFPIPIAAEGTGLCVGDIRKTTFLSSTKGSGDLVLKVIKSEPSTITFKVISDSSHIAHWLSWDTITISCLPLNDKQTAITWTSTYTCDLNPRWYFVPLERYAVSLANEHLIHSYFR